MQNFTIIHNSISFAATCLLQIVMEVGICRYSERTVLRWHKTWRTLIDCVEYTDLLYDIQRTGVITWQISALFPNEIFMKTTISRKVALQTQEMPNGILGSGSYSTAQWNVYMKFDQQLQTNNTHLAFWYPSVHRATVVKTAVRETTL